MKDDLKHSLAAIFDAADDKKRAVEERKIEAETAEAVFLREFLEARTGVIRPAMEAVIEIVKERGRVCEISETEDAYHGTEKRGIPAGIRFTVYASAQRKAVYEHPGLSFICDKIGKKVSLHKSTMGPGHGGSAGGIGSVALDEVTEEFVQSHLVKLLREIPL